MVSQTLGDLIGHAAQSLCCQYCGRMQTYRLCRPSMCPVRVGKGDPTPEVRGITTRSSDVITQLYAAGLLEVTADNAVVDDGPAMPAASERERPVKRSAAMSVDSEEDFADGTRSVRRRRTQEVLVVVDQPQHGNVAWVPNASAVTYTEANIGPYLRSSDSTVSLRVSLADYPSQWGGVVRQCVLGVRWCPPVACIDQCGGVCVVPAALCACRSRGVVHGTGCNEGNAGPCFVRGAAGTAAAHPAVSTRACVHRPVGLGCAGANAGVPHCCVQLGQWHARQLLRWQADWPARRWSGLWWWQLRTWWQR